MSAPKLLRHLLFGAFGLLGATLPVQSEFEFSEPVFYRIGQGAGPFAVEDFDGDGDADVVVGNLDFGTVTLLKNDGFGILGSPVHDQAGESVAALAAGDLDGDSDSDLIIADDGIYTKSIIPLINSGTGTFELGEKVALFDLVENANLHLRGLVLTDLDRDELPDVAVACESSQPVVGFIEVALNLGGGLIGEASKLTVGQVGLTSPMNLAAIDFTGDGHSDLAGVNRTSDPFLFEATESGDLLPVAINPSVSVVPTFLIGGNVDTDGDDDLILISEGGRRVEVRFNNSDSTFSNAQAISTGANRPSSAALADFDGDGDVDLVVTDQTETFLFPSRGMPSIRWAENQGAGIFLPAFELSFEEYPGIPEWVETADLDGDGDSDVLVTDRIEGKLAVYFNQRIPAAFSSGDLDGDDRLGLLDLLAFGGVWYQVTSSQ